MVESEECAKRVAMGFGVGAALGSSIGGRRAAARAARAPALLSRCTQTQAACRLTHAARARAPNPAAAGAVYGTYGAFKYKVRRAARGVRRAAHA